MDYRQAVCTTNIAVNVTTIDGDMPTSYWRYALREHGLLQSAVSFSWERRMAARKKATRKKTPSRKRSAGSTPRDALALLRADHQAVQELFDKFEKTRSDERKGAIAQQICNELTVHAQIEEEIFYPAAREAIRQKDLIEEATVEHQSAKDLIAQIEGAKPGQELYDAKVKVLGEYIRHHVKEEQNELFAQVRKTKLDLKELGERLQARKQELMEGGASGSRNKSGGLSGSSSRGRGGSDSESGTQNEGLVARMARGIGLGSDD
jgi:hemerythrin-like domain-containing protein